jgi:ABC-type uncharacterized transport system permease subunit
VSDDNGTDAGDSIPMEKEIPYQKIYTANLTLAILSAIIATILIYLLVRIYMRIKLTNKIILAMIFFLILDMIANCVWYSYVAHDNKVLEKNFQADPDDPVFKYTVLDLVPVTFFLIGCMLNLNNWIFYYFKIGEMASFVDKRAKIHGN